MVKEEKKNITEKGKAKKIADEKPSEDKKTREKPAVSLATPKKRSLVRKHVPRAQAYIVCSYNNTLITVTDPSGNVLGWCSSGSLGFKGPKKSTPFAATLVAQKVIEKTARFGLKEIQIYIKGVGGGREASVRAFGNAGLASSLIKDNTPVPHNGCRAKKPRRV
jgi:small subunit ribosomal protein S11